jgi:GMP synthase (glutamine-hydrolysing)
MILIIDFGSQTTHLIGRRIRELGVSNQIVNPSDSLSAALKLKPKGIILSGGPSSVYAKDGLLVDKKIFELGVPVLGICYGLQIMSHLLGGKVSPGTKKEYGPAQLTRTQKSSALFKNLPDTFQVWMSHFDQAVKNPTASDVTATTQTIPIAAFENKKENMYGIQFHPEVVHTQFGTDILKNFVFGICREVGGNSNRDLTEIVTSIKNIIGMNQKAVCALSGGIDSAVAATLVSQAIGENLICFYVNTGLMREGETQQIVDTFQKHFKLNLHVIQAESVFLNALKGIIDPEKKRKVIGETFIRLFETEAKKIGAPYLVQGTIYPDVIESKGTIHAQVIKTHHNVGGLPEKHGFKLVEPLRQFYKDEVRTIARQLGFPNSLINRHVYPGPGLAVRIIGEVTKEKLDILRRADVIVVDEIKKAGLYDDIWMAFAVFTGAKSTGVGGDERKYGETIAVRVIESKDTMTADWVRLPYEVLAKISNRIVTEVFEVVRVVYDITSKPPATMEWE